MDNLTYYYQDLKDDYMVALAKRDQAMMNQLLPKLEYCEHEIFKTEGALR